MDYYTLLKVVFCCVHNAVNRWRESLLLIKQLCSVRHIMQHLKGSRDSLLLFSDYF